MTVIEIASDPLFHAYSQQRAARATSAAIRELIPAVRAANLPMLDYLLGMVLVETDRVDDSQALTVEKG